jgi:hypothetical protein
VHPTQAAIADGVHGHDVLIVDVAVGKLVVDCVFLPGRQRVGAGSGRDEQDEADGERGPEGRVHGRRA